MKNIFKMAAAALMVLLFAFPASAQSVPNGFNYQAVLRSNDGKPLVNKQVTVRFQLTDASGADIYWVEDHTVTTSTLGTVNLVIGTGTKTGGTAAAFAQIPFASSQIKVNVLLDAENNGTFASIGNTPMWSVPYAMVAGNAAGGGGKDTVHVFTHQSDTVRVFTHQSDTVRIFTSDTVYSFGDTVHIYNFTSDTLYIVNYDTVHVLTSDTVYSYSQDTVYIGTGSSVWQQSGNDIYYRGGLVGVGTSNPLFRLHIMDTLGTGRNSSLLVNTNGSSVNGTAANITFRGSGSTTRAINASATYTGSSSGNTVIGIFSLAEGSRDANYGVFSRATSYTPNSNYGVLGYADSAETENIGVIGRADGVDAGVTNIGVLGRSNGDGYFNMGMYGFAVGTGGTFNIGVYGSANGALANYAGVFEGDVYVDGDLTISGTLAKSAGSFKIDHPQDPANKYLIHSFVESPDMMNVYNGNITTGADSLAIVELPAYFMELNRDYRYQLTVIGSFAQAVVWQKVEGNRFVIKTNQPNVEVSWQVTGIRQDPYAKAHPIVPEVEKSAQEKGRYLNPELYGAGRQQGIVPVPKVPAQQPPVQR